MPLFILQNLSRTGRLVNTSVDLGQSTGEWEYNHTEPEHNYTEPEY
jgi:hypothetical protein